jgi:hypothetical protein
MSAMRDALRSAVASAAFSRHFDVIPGNDTPPELGAESTSANPQASFQAAADNLHEDLTRLFGTGVGSASDRLTRRLSASTRINGVTVYRATGRAKIDDDNCILLVTGDDQGNATAESTGKDAAAYAVAGVAPAILPANTGTIACATTPDQTATSDRVTGDQQTDAD